MFICMDAGFYLLLENLCERGGGRKLTRIYRICSHFHNITGFKVTMTLLHVCAFAVVSLYTCMWLPTWWNRLRGMKINCKVPQPFESWMPEGILTQNLLKFRNSEMQFSVQLRAINRILLMTIFNLHFCMISFRGFSIMKKSY